MVQYPPFPHTGTTRYHSMPRFFEGSTQDVVGITGGLHNLFNCGMWWMWWDEFPNFFARAAVGGTPLHTTRTIEGRISVDRYAAFTHATHPSAPPERRHRDTLAHTRHPNTDRYAAFTHATHPSVPAGSAAAEETLRVSESSLPQDPSARSAPLYVQAAHPSVPKVCLRTNWSQEAHLAWDREPNTSFVTTPGAVKRNFDPTWSQASHLVPSAKPNAPLVTSACPGSPVSTDWSQRFNLLTNANSRCASCDQNSLDTKPAALQMVTTLQSANECQ